ncbi:MAG: DUF3570 domain-containing protein, partial [Bacteroidota bacterium]
LADFPKLLGARLKLPIGLRLNTYLSEWLVSRLYYRYYWDNWGIRAHTVGLELPIKLSRFLAIYPHYRYHHQSAADYFAAYQEHVEGSEFYTSDFDLSALQSHGYGVGVIYSPTKGLAKIGLPFRRRDLLLMQSVELKYSHYNRSTGLTADIVSLAVKFSY